jgi:hypothetical protein
LSTISNFPNHESSPSSNDAILGEPVKQSIVCHDVQVPPGKLNVIIHSTNDGPAIYSVNEGSALVNKLFPGDLITALDGVDTRANYQWSKYCIWWLRRMTWNERLLYCTVSRLTVNCITLLRSDFDWSNNLCTACNLLSVDHYQR